MSQQVAFLPKHGKNKIRTETVNGSITVHRIENNIFHLGAAFWTTSMLQSLPAARKKNNIYFSRL